MGRKESNQTNMHDKSFRKVYHPIVTISKSPLLFSENICVFLLLSADSALVYASSFNKFCSVYSPPEDTVDFPCEDSKSSVVEEKKEVKGQGH